MSRKERDHVGIIIVCLALKQEHLTKAVVTVGVK